jgi:hypothetical protein
VPFPKRKIRLKFDDAEDRLPDGKRLSDGMSAAAAWEDTLWLAHDETLSIERLRANKSPAGVIQYAGHRRFDLRTLIALPASEANLRQGASLEADLEGMAIADGCLWITGSHSAMRDSVKYDGSPEAIAALANVRRAGHRFLLARIPMQPSAAGPVLVRELALRSGQVVRAARLPGGRKNDALTRLLREDPHLGPYLAIPSKDNGFDIEGLAAAPGGRVFLGLRGPVIDGWACVLEISLTTHSRRAGELAFCKLPGGSRTAQRSVRYRKHFLDFEGSGVRDLCLAGQDLLILSGPPMRGKGKARVHLWKRALAVKRDSMIDRRRLPELLELSYGEKNNHPEGLAIVGQRGKRVLLMAIYESIDNDQRAGRSAMWATLHTVALG